MKRRTATKHRSTVGAVAKSKGGRRELRPFALTPLFRGVDHGGPVELPAKPFLDESPGGWSALADRFHAINREALDGLGAELRLDASLAGSRLHVLPGGRAGAVPLKSPLTGRVAAGLLIKPRFGWAGVGQILLDTGWHAAPTVLDMPAVPGSASEVPPWVLAGPVLARLADLLRDMKRGYEFVDEPRTQPKGTINWVDYARRHVARGDLHHVPCRFPDLGTDPEIVQAVRWTLERLHGELARVGGHDRIATALVHLALRLIEQVRHARAERPKPETLHLMLATNPYLADTLRRGLQAIGWIVEERGLGGSDTSDGLAWSLSLEMLWEQYVEAQYRREARMTGATVRAGRLGETTFPLQWSQPLCHSMTHLVPDLVLQRDRDVHIIDAKYKAHFAELDEHGWRDFQDEQRSAHRADIHQVLAYASLFDARSINATLVYPLTRNTFLELSERNQDRSVATLYHGERKLTLELRGMPFGEASA